MNVKWERLRSWSSCRAVGLGVTAKRNTMGTKVDDPRQRILYEIEVTIFTRKLVITHWNIE
jgi:hypothetical protein